jgi:hypothetical protein
MGAVGAAAAVLALIVVVAGPRGAPAPEPSPDARASVPASTGARPATTKRSRRARRAARAASGESPPPVAEAAPAKGPPAQQLAALVDRLDEELAKASARPKRGDDDDEDGDAFGDDLDDALDDVSDWVEAQLTPVAAERAADLDRLMEAVDGDLEELEDASGAQVAPARRKVQAGLRVLRARLSDARVEFHRP